MLSPSFSTSSKAPTKQTTPRRSSKRTTKPMDLKQTTQLKDLTQPMDLDLESQLKLQPTINVGMIGHVAHGKSTLTKALSNVATGRFHTEKEKGMTIRLGYANVKIWKCLNPLCPKPWCYHSTGASQKKPPPCQRPGCTSSTTLVRHFSFVDAPGHHELMSTMLSGASVMDGALLVISADEPCPCPQTAEHLVAAEIMGISTNAVVVQNKVDLCTVERCVQSQREIKSFLKGTRAEKATTIPLIARMGLNVDMLCQKLVECIPNPDRDLISPSRMLVIRSFDINKPGTLAERLQGGVIGGSLLRGVLKVGEEIEIRPGIIRTDGSFAPIFTRVVSLRSEDTPLQQAIPGGLIAIGLTIDPRLCKGDLLVGQVAGRVGTLPPVFREVGITFQLLRHVVGSVEEKKAAETEGTGATSKPTKLAKPKIGEELLLCIGSDKLRATVTSVNSKIKNQMRVSFGKTSLACADKDSKVAIFRMESPRQWRLIGSGSLCDIHALSPSSSLLLAAPESLKASEIHPEPSSSSSSDTKASAPTTEEKSKASALEGEKEKEKKVSEKGLKKSAQKRTKGKSETEEENPDQSQEAQSQEEPEETQPIDRSRCGMYPSEFPEVGDFVLVKITKVIPGVGAYGSLLEYSDRNALVNEKELSRKRVKSLKQVVRVGSLEVAVVLRVDKEKGFIDLSKKRVEPRENQKHQAWYAKSKIVDRIVRRVAASAKTSLEDLYKIFVWPLYEKAQGKLELHPLESFQAALCDQDAVFGVPSLQFDVSVRENVLQILMDNIQHRFPPRPVRAVATLEVSCLSFQGINAIITALQHGLNAYASSQNSSNNLKAKSLDGQEAKSEQESKVERITEPIQVIEQQVVKETKSAVKVPKSKRDKTKKGLPKSNETKIERVADMTTENPDSMKETKASKASKSEKSPREKELPKFEKTKIEKPVDTEVKLYLDASPFFILSVQSQKEKEALNAVNFIYGEIRTKIVELGGSASWAKRPQVQMV